MPTLADAAANDESHAGAGSKLHRRQGRKEIEEGG